MFYKSSLITDRVATSSNCFNRDKVPDPAGVSRSHGPTRLKATGGDDSFDIHINSYRTMHRYQCLLVIR